MTRNELKNLWFSIPKQDNKKEIKLDKAIEELMTKNISYKEFDKQLNKLTTNY